MAFVLFVIFSATSSAFNLNSFSILQSTGTMSPPARFSTASYNRKLGFGKITSSPDSMNACALMYNDSLAPTVTITFSGSVLIPLSFLNFLTISSLNSMYPLFGVYCVSLLSIDFFIASLMFCGTLKSGSPIPKFIAPGFVASNIFLIWDSSINLVLLAGLIINFYLTII